MKNGLRIYRRRTLRKTYSEKRNVLDKIKLSTRKAYNYSRVYHPLKNKKIRLHRLKFVKEFCLAWPSNENNLFLRELPLPSRRISHQTNKIRYTKMWVTEDDVVNWLSSVGEKIKCITDGKYILRNKVYSINHIIILANRRRVELGLKPFYIEGVTEF